MRSHGAGQSAASHGRAVAKRQTAICVVDALDSCAERGSDGDCVWIERVRGNVNSVTDGEKSVETLDKIGVAMKKTRNALYDSWSVDAAAQ